MFCGKKQLFYLLPREYCLMSTLLVFPSRPGMSQHAHTQCPSGDSVPKDEDKVCTSTCVTAGSSDQQFCSTNPPLQGYNLLRDSKTQLHSTYRVFPVKSKPSDGVEATPLALLSCL